MPCSCLKVSFELSRITLISSSIEVSGMCLDLECEYTVVPEILLPEEKQDLHSAAGCGMCWGLLNTTGIAKSSVLMSPFDLHFRNLSDFLLGPLSF